MTAAGPHAQLVERLLRRANRIEQGSNMTGRSDVALMRAAASALERADEPGNAEIAELLSEWLMYTGLRHRAFDPDLDPDDDEYESGRSLVRRTDAAIAAVSASGQTGAAE